MHLEYTPEEVRELVAESPVLSYRAATSADVLDVADILEGVGELIAKLDSTARHRTLSDLVPVLGENGELWVPVANNCRRSCGVSVSTDGLLSFTVRGEGDGLVSYFAARQAAAHALSGRAVVDAAALPAPDENVRITGAAFTGCDAENDLEGSEGSAEDILYGLDACGSLEREIGAVDFVLEGLAGDEPSDLAAEGLAYPANVSVRYLGNASEIPAAVAVDLAADTGVDDAGEHELHPDWRERLAVLGESGELPQDLVDDALSLIEGSAAGFAPGEFVAELTRRRAASCLTERDLDAEARAARLGAVDPGEADLGADSVGRLSAAGRAHLRNVSGELLLVPEGAPAGLVEEAARRARRSRADERERARERRLLGILATAFEPAGALSLRAVLGRLGGPARKDFLRDLVRSGELKARRIDGEVILSRTGAPDPVFHRAARLAKRVRSESFGNMKTAAARARARGSKAFPAPVVPFGGTKLGPGELAEALDLEKAKASARDSGRTAARVERPGSFDCEVYVGREGTVHVLPVYRREVRVFRSPGAYHAWPVSVTTVLHDPEGAFESQLAEERAAGFGRSRQSSPDWADRLPQAERESGPDPEGSYARLGRSAFEAERAGEAVISTRTGKVLAPARSPKQREAARRRVGRMVARSRARSEAEARMKAREDALACRAAWEKALSIHLASLPAAERLELFLSLRGRREFAALERSARDPEELKVAARELAAAGRVRVRRGRSSGEVFLEVAGELDRKALERGLLAVMARAQPGEIPVPKGTRLARRVAATRGVLTKAARTTTAASRKAKAAKESLAA